MRSPPAAILLLLSACVHASARAPGDGRERQRAEFRACQDGTFPPWLDDEAAQEAARVDRWGTATFGYDWRDSYRTGTGSSVEPPLPPPSAAARSSTSRYSAIMEQRRAFRARCELLLGTRRGPALPRVR